MACVNTDFIIPSFQKTCLVNMSAHTPGYNLLQAHYASNLQM